jgi:RNA polymerase-binding transcription factor DksA
MTKAKKKEKARTKPKRAAAARKPAAKKAVRKSAKPAPARRTAARPSVRPASRAAAKKAASRGSARSPVKSSRKKVLCEFCGAEIPPERVEVLPDTTTCVECSQTKPYSEAQIIGLNGEDAENRLNVEDFEEADTDFSISYNDQW